MNLLSTFHFNGISIIKELKTCIETDNIPLYTIHAHALKSACAIIGAVELSKAAAALETAGKNGDLSFIHSNNAAFMSDFERILNNINAALIEESKESPKNHIDKNLLKTEILKLKTALNDIDYVKMEEAVNFLQDYTHTENIGDRVKFILKNVLIGEYEEAESMADALLRDLDNSQ